VSVTHKLLRFGVFEVNLTTEELRNSGTIVKLPPQPFKLLALLANRAGEIVTRDEIQKLLWDNQTFVDFDKGVNKCILQIRNALNDNADRPLYIETVPRKGYRFLAPVKSKTVEVAPGVLESGPGTAPVALVKERLAAVPPATIASAAVQEPANTESAAIKLEPGHAHVREETFDNGTLSPQRRYKRLIVAIAAFLIAWIAAVLIIRRPWTTKTAASTEGVVVVADFLNSTGDPVFDGALKQALSIALEQSPYINALPDRTIATTLRLMNLQPGERVTRDIAREICLRTNSKAMLIGSIAPTGDHLLITVEALDCHSEETLVSAQAEVENKALVLKVLGDLGARLRYKLGETLSSIQDFNRPLEEATTGSLEALQAYSRGRSLQLSDGKADEIIDQFKQAITLDPNFAYAYAALGAFYGNMGETNLSLENFKQAYSLRERVNKKERFYIEAHYYQDVTQEPERAIQTYADWIRDYPEDYIPHNNLSVIYLAVGQANKAVVEAQKSMALLPDNSNAYLICMRALMALNRVDEAKLVYQEARKHNLTGPLLDIQLYYVAFLQHDNSTMQQQYQAGLGRPSVANMFLGAQADTEAYYGRVSEARQLSAQAVKSAMEDDAKETAAGWLAVAGLREAEIGNFAVASEAARKALQLSSGREEEAMAAMTFARAGRTDQAKLLVGKLARDYPTSTIIQAYIIPPILASCELWNKNPLRAIELLQASEPYELGDAFISTANFGNLYPVYVRGLAYLQAGNGPAAVSQFKKIQEQRGFITNYIFGSLVLLQLGRAQGMVGDMGAARRSYQDFLAAWKDAEPDIPALKEAREEYAKLQ
jgi:DNA-binding winged helix-turn-helix (wHTH) protein/tetratricopeptide (TPR) repeat protein